MLKELVAAPLAAESMDFAFARDDALPAALAFHALQGSGHPEENVLSVDEVAAGMVERSGLLARTPGRILATRTAGELRDVVATILGGLYPRSARFELFVADEGRRLAPVTGGASSTGRHLLASLRSRGVASRDGLARSSTFPANPDVGLGSLMSAPLLDGAATPVGLVVVEAAPGARDFTDRDRAVLEGIAALVTVGLQRLRSEDQEAARARARIDLDRKSACRVQRRLMSGTLPSGIGVTAETGYLPALDVGGDFYSLKYLGDGQVGVAIGDVSGNGVAAALLMSRVAADIERALGDGARPSTVLRAVNGGLSDVESESFVTASCLRLDARTRKLTIANAGHLPLVVRRASGEVFTCGGASGTPLGMVPCEYDDEELILEPMDILLLMTDGLLEAIDHPSGRLGMPILLRLVRDAPHDPRVIGARIRAAVDRARREHVLDDVTWVGLQIAA